MQRPTTTYADWDRTDNFLIPADPILDAGVANAAKNGLPDIAVSAAQGKFLYLLAKTIGAKRIVEVGTLGGYVVAALGVPLNNGAYLFRYSATWLARALPDGGELIGLEVDAKHAKVRH